MTKNNRKILDMLDAGECIIGDGGYTYALERRGYMTPGEWTPECVIEYPEAVSQCHTDYALCGADILQAYVFNGTDDNLNFARRKDGRPLLCAKEVNDAGCRLVTEVAKKHNKLIGLPVSTTRSYAAGESKEKVQKEFQQQIDIFKNWDGDLLMAEYVGCVEEAEWACEIMKKTNIPISISMCIGPLGDFKDVSVEEVAVRLAKAGCDIIGVNCRFDPDTCIDTTVRMREAVEKAGMKCHYMVQPIAYRTADADRIGFGGLPECPLALENRLITRWDAQKYARKAYDNGIRYIGGCCGFEPYHIRALAEELRNERGGRLPPNSRCLDASTLIHHENEHIRKIRSSKDYWMNLVPGSGYKKLIEKTG
uniref:Hcy-binding domain-containing protein n=2 Tax=Clytia hemisphaerica TaxID=252671 RepID=A0A7M5X3G4_9CNID